MGMLDIFFGKAPETYEKKGDIYCDRQDYGWAKDEYEKALLALAKKPDADQNYQQRLEHKLAQAKERLACSHLKTAGELIEAQVFDEAADLLCIASDLTAAPDLKAEIEKQLQAVRQACTEPEAIRFPAGSDDGAESDVIQVDDDEQFRAMIGALPEQERDAYASYGDAFKAGYVALHNGDFETAATALAAALDENAQKKSYIPLELATAQLNLGMHEEAYALLEGFVADHPEALKAYSLMCDILWERGDFDAARKLLGSCPDSVAAGMPVTILKGETLCREQLFQQAADLYTAALETHGWQDPLARALAYTCEMLGLNNEARELYGRLLGACQGCGSKPDPYIMQRYADTSFAAGDYSLKILELYLSLSKTNPANRPHYFQNISRIYAHMGNDKEARRFAAFAQD